MKSEIDQHIKKNMNYRTPDVIMCGQCKHLIKETADDGQGWDYNCGLNPANIIIVEPHYTCDFAEGKE